MHTERSQIEQIIQRFGEVLKSKGIIPENIILFGSYAKGTASEYSDIDLVIVSQDFAGLSLIERCTIMGQAIAEIMEPIEPLAYTPEEFARLSPHSVIGSVMNDPMEHLKIH